MRNRASIDKWSEVVANLRTGYPGTFGFVIACVTVLGCAVLSPSYSIVSLVLLFAIAGVASNLLAGFTGLLSFAQGVFFGLGAYTAGLASINWGTPAIINCFLGALVGATAAAIIGAIAIRRRGVYFVMLTFAFAAMFGFLAYVLRDITQGENGLQGVPIPRLSLFGITTITLTSPLSMFLLIGVLFVLTYTFFSRILESPFGHVIRAIRDNEDRAVATGYDVQRIKVYTFVISGFATGLSGALYALLLGTVPPSAIQLDMSTQIFIITIIGGAASLYGGFLGALVYVVASQYLPNVWDRWQLLLGLLLLAVVFFLPDGFVSLIRAIRKGKWPLGPVLRRRGIVTSIGAEEETMLTETPVV